MSVGQDGSPKRSGRENPPAASLKEMMEQYPLPIIEEGTVVAEAIKGDAATQQSQIVLDDLNNAIEAEDVNAVAACFFGTQAWWKDSLALTYHLRTFISPSAIAEALIKTSKMRQIGKFSIDEGAVFIPATPSLEFIDCGIVFRTGSPAATCTGKIVLLPIKDDHHTVKWKVWVLNTRLSGLDIQPEDTSLLNQPTRNLDGIHDVKTQVLIVGAGNAAISLAARLKAMNVESIMIERNSRVGDNWALRYDNMKFHVPTSFCELPYLSYPEHQKAPYLLSKDDLADQVIRYVDTFHLNTLTSSNVTSTIWDSKARRWTVEVESPKGKTTVDAAHLVQATGIGSQKPYIPQIIDNGYKGKAMHSQSFRSGKKLATDGVKSVIIVGSANTAFDVLEDCHSAGLSITMNVRSPTYICPTEYALDKRSLGFYDLGVPAADKLFLSLPAAIDGALAKGLFTMMASQEPDRYKPLAEKGFPVITSLDPDAALMSNLVEECGKHYMDLGATQLIVDGKVALRVGVEPRAFTPSGLEFTDGSKVDADAVIWCTGFADLDATTVTTEILGKGVKVDPEYQLGPSEIASRLDTTWGLDHEGEIRGMWKRHSRLDGVNYWIAGGYTQLHRYHSQTLALQIKAELEGILPPAFRD